MANQQQLSQAQPGDILLVVHDFEARSPDELSLKRGDKVELIEKDDDFGDGWFLGRHLSRDDTGLFPALYTRASPKTTAATGASRHSAPQQTPAYANKTAIGPPGDEHASAPSVQPPELEGSQHHAMPMQPHSERSFSAPYPSAAEETPAPQNTPNRPGPTSVAQRSISISNETHQNSPVMNETLSVIEEHITDMSTPRHSFLLPDNSSMHQGDDTPELRRRLSYIHGEETDEEESAALTEAEVRSWSPERVSEYLEDLGVDPKHCAVFQEQEISGDVLLGMDQGSLMLKEFELGSIGKRLALWQKIKAMQEEIKTGAKRPRAASQLNSSTPPIDSARNRATSVGMVLPRIPSFSESSQRSVSRQNSRGSPTKPMSRLSESVASVPDQPSHTPRPSAASVRSLNQNRRHSSMDQAMTSPMSKAPTDSPTAARHSKHGSFDQSWTMVGNDSSTFGSPTLVQTPDLSQKGATTPNDNGMIVVSSLDLDRGYFSGNEVDNRDRSNKLKKRLASPPLHGRAPSDSYGNKRLSAVFRSRRQGSTDSVNDPELSATQQLYGKAAAQGRAAQHKKHSSMSPTVTKLDYGNSPSIDAVASSPNIAGSETSSLERPAPSKSMFQKTRLTGLRAISDAITGDEKRNATSPTSPTAPTREKPPQSPGSSTPSINSRSIDVDEASQSSLLKEKAAGSGRETPIIPKRRGKKATSAYTRGLLQKGPKEMMEGCDYSGWMKKKSSNLMTTWKTRLFILRGTRLSYYYAEDDKEEKGLIDISFHRVLPANNERMLGLHAMVSGAGGSPTSPQNAQIETAAAKDAEKTGLMKGDDSGIFIFKLVPPRAGLSKAVTFTKPMVHYFAVDNIQQGRLWMAALMKATIERDEAHQVITTYKEKTISLAKAKAMRQLPPFLDTDDKDKEKEKGLNITYSNDNTDADAATVTTNGDKEGSFTTGGATEANKSLEDVGQTATETSASS